MATTTAALTVEEFQQLNFPSDQRVELVAGQVVNLGNAKPVHELIKANITELLILFNLKDKSGKVFSETTYKLGPYNTRMPDVSFRLKDQLAIPPDGSYWTAPALAVEIVSSESAAELMRRVEDYLGAGSRTVWVVYPENRSLAVYEADGSTRLLHDKDTVEISWLPGLRAGIGDFFEGL